jgi:hypothetical protein
MDLLTRQRKLYATTPLWLLAFESVRSMSPACLNEFIQIALRRECEPVEQETKRKGRVAYP